MASDPWFDKRRGIWLMKYRPDPTKGWVRVTLCKHPTDWSASRPPKKPPQLAIDRARQFAEVEYKAKHGLGAAPKRVSGLSDYMNGFLESYRTQKRRSSVAQMERHIKRFLEFAERKGITTTQAVTRAHCRDYLEERLKHLSINSLKTERAYLRGIWSRAVEDEIIPANPWAFAKVAGKIAATETTEWTSEEVAAIAQACSKPWQSDLVVLLANTGLRIRTALLFRWDWIDWTRGTITIPAGTEDVKTGYTHVLGRVARDILQRRRVEVDAELVFPRAKGGVIPYDTFRDALRRAIAKAGARAGSPHDFRHTYARSLMAAGVPVNVVQAQLGHASLTTTQRYSVASETATLRAIGEWGIGDA